MLPTLRQRERHKVLLLSTGPRCVVFPSLGLGLEPKQGTQSAATPTRAYRHDMRCSAGTTCDNGLSCVLPSLGRAHSPSSSPEQGARACVGAGQICGTGEGSELHQVPGTLGAAVRNSQLWGLFLFLFASLVKNRLRPQLSCT